MEQSLGSTGILLADNRSKFIIVGEKVYNFFTAGLTLCGGILQQTYHLVENCLRAFAIKFGIAEIVNIALHGRQKAELIRLRSEIRRIIRENDQLTREIPIRPECRDVMALFSHDGLVVSPRRRLPYCTKFYCEALPENTNDDSDIIEPQKGIDDKGLILNGDDQPTNVSPEDIKQIEVAPMLPTTGDFS